MIEAQFIVNEEIFSSVRAFISEQAGAQEKKSASRKPFIRGFRYRRP